MLRFLIVAFGLCLFSAQLHAAEEANVPGLSNEELVCRAPAAQLSKYEYLRALSLDIRGVPPSMTEYAQLHGEEDVPESLIDSWLASPEFSEQIVAFHRDLLWPNLSNLELFNRNFEISKSQDLYYRRYAGQYFRGERVACLNEPATWDAEGNLVMKLQEDGTLREGYVWVTPYWAPETQIKMCALGAQESLQGQDGTNCHTSGGYKSVGCGCGPNLMWCEYKLNQTLLSAMVEDVDRRIRAHLAKDEPYMELLTNTSAYVNGPLAYYLKNLTFQNRTIKMTPLAISNEQIPDMDVRDSETWVEIDLPPYHSGLLTSPAFLLRFQTNRARATQYYTKFLCQPFKAPSGGLPPVHPDDVLVTDLQVRSGCSYCHANLEPAAAHWGRWLEVGAGFRDDTEYPDFNEDCFACATTSSNCSNHCKNYYVVKAANESEEPYFGWLKPFLFRADDHMKFINEGPRMLVMRTTVDNRMPLCLTRNLTSWLIGRDLYEDEEAWLFEATTNALQSGMKLRQAVKEVLMSDLYRRVK